MEKHDEELIRSLVDKDNELKQYYEEHVTLGKQLATFQHKHFLTPEEEIEKKRLQKLKLAGMDHIMGLLGKYRSS